LQRFLEAAKMVGLTFNESKSTIGVKVTDLLGYRVSQGRMQPDPSHLQPLLALRPPSSLKELKQLCGLFADYAKWIANFSKKSRSLQTATEFPLTGENVEAFNTLKNDLITASLGVIKHDVSSEEETDASD